MDRVAWVSRVGGSVRHDDPDVSVRVCADLEFALRRPPLPGEEGYWQRALQLAAAAGIELQMGWLTLRTGSSWSELQTGNLAGLRFSFGGGLRLGSINLDLAMILDQLGLVYILGAEFRFRTP